VLAEYAADFYLLQLESIGGSKYTATWGHLPPQEQIDILVRLFNGRGLSIKGADDYYRYYVSMPCTGKHARRNAPSVTIDFDTGESEWRVPMREFTSGQERGAPTWPCAPTTKSRYTLDGTFKWVDAEKFPEDDPKKVLETFHEPEWFAPIYGSYEGESDSEEE
jgi:hypothetical protein